MRIRFVVEKETLNTIRYAELPEEGEPKAIGTQYVQKSALKKEFGDIPQFLIVTMEAE